MTLIVLKEGKGKAKGKEQKERAPKRTEGERRGKERKGREARSECVSVSPARTDSESSGYIQNKRSSKRSVNRRAGRGREK